MSDNRFAGSTSAGSASSVGASSEGKPAYPPPSVLLQNSPTDEDWCHIQETVTMLYLASCQIEASIQESSKSVDKLGHSFTKLAFHTMQVREQAQSLTDISQLDQFKLTLNQTTEEMHHRINEAITAFQFYDRICQRLDHVTQSLNKMTAVMSDSTQLHSPEAWDNIQKEVKASCSMEAERIMFEHIIRGSSVEEALDIYNHHFSANDVGTDSSGDEVELF